MPPKEKELPPQSETEAVKVAVRVRPFNSTEKKDGSQVAAIITHSKTAMVTVKIADKGGKGTGASQQSFQFDHVFWSMEGPDADGCPPVNQQHVYESIGRPLLDHAFGGFNACLFAYGQTGSGKTHTMMGYGADKGVIPRLCDELFQRKVVLEKSSGAEWGIAMGFIEIYNEKVMDLLSPKVAGKEAYSEVREHATKGIIVQDQVQEPVKTPEDVASLIDRGNKTRHVAATSMNDQSSRSHAIVQLFLTEQRRIGEAQVMTHGKSCRVNLVDLAGSERVAQSQVTGAQFTEAKNINLSLTTLGRVIDVLADKASGKGAKGAVTPYRDSKLTFILRDSLGGNSKTNMIAAISPSSRYTEETISTLRYASRAREIVNTAKVNEDPRARRIRELEEQMAMLKREKSASGADPTYVLELEEKLKLMEADSNKRAADLQAFELEKQRAEMNDKMLKATQAEKANLQKEMDEVTRKMESNRQLAEQHEKEVLQLKADKERKEKELNEKIELKDAEMERMAQQLQKMAKSHQQLEKTMGDLDKERQSRADALKELEDQRSKLANALANSEQTNEQRVALAAQNDLLSKQIQDAQMEAQHNKKLLSELQTVKEEHTQMEKTNRTLRGRSDTLHLEVQELTRRMSEISLNSESNFDIISAKMSDIIGRLIFELQHSQEKEADALSKLDNFGTERAELESTHSEILAETNTALQKITAASQHKDEQIAEKDEQIAELKSSSDAKISALSGEVSTLQSTVSEKDEQIAELKSSSDAKISALSVEVSTLQSEVAVLTSQIAALNKELVSSKFVIKEHRARIDILKEGKRESKGVLGSTLRSNHEDPLAATFGAGDGLEDDDDLVLSVPLARRPRNVYAATKGMRRSTAQGGDAVDAREEE